MADAFAPQLNSEVRFNQPVERPSMLGAVAELGGNFISAFGQSRQGQGGAAATKADPNVAVFQQGLERVEAIREERGEVAAQIAERQLAKNFAMNGINLGTDYKEVYETSTGRPWAGYGMDVEAQMLQETLKDPQVQSSYIASYAVNKDWTEEQRIEYAVGQKAQLTAMENEITRAKTEAGYKWTTQSESAYGGAVDTFTNTIFGGMANAVSQGGRVGPQDIANVQAQWAQLRGSLTIPRGVSEEQWKATQAKIDAVDKTLTAFEKASSNEVLLNEITSALSNSLLQQGGGSPESALAVMVANKDPATFANLAGISAEKFVMTVGKNINLNIATTDLFGHIVSDQEGVGPNPDPNSFLKTLPAEVKTNIEGKTPEQIYSGLEASGMLTAVVKPNDLNRPEAREQFTENAATIGAVMQATGSDTFLSNDFLKKLVANPGFIRNINALDAVDPEAATVARTYVRSGLNVELGKQQRNLESIESNLGVKWNGNAYVLDRQGLMTKNGWTEQQADGFIAWVGKTYGGDLSRLANGTTPMPEGMGFQPVGLQQAYDRRASINTINLTMKELAIAVEGQEGTATETATPTTTVGSGYRIPEEVAQDQEFVSAAGKLAADLSIPVDDVFRVIEFETAGSWSPAVRPITKGGERLSSAVGLIQFLESTAKGLGTSTAELEGMTRAQQMEYVGKYLEPYKGRIKNFGDLYMAVHYPKAIGQSETYVMYSQGSAEYAANKNLDTNGDGTVTRGETVASVIARTGGGRGVMTTPATAQTAEFAQQAAADITTAAPPGGFSAAPATLPTPAATAAPVASPEAATAALPEEVQRTQPDQLSQQEAARNAAPIDQDVAALIKEIAGSPDKIFETEREFLAAQQRGELEPGDTLVVDGVAYMVRKDGTAKRLGVVQE